MTARFSSQLSEKRAVIDRPYSWEVRNLFPRFLRFFPSHCSFDRFGFFFERFIRIVFPLCLSPETLWIFFTGIVFLFRFRWAFHYFLLTLPVVVTHPVGQRVPAICPK